MLKMKSLSLSNTLLLLLRLSFGTLFLYAGLTKVFDPGWSAAGYMKSAQTFSGFYTWLAESSALPLVNFINEWGLVLLGISLIIGLFVRLSAPLGALLMILYYFPGLDFPFVGAHGLLIDDHIIYALALLYLASANAGNFWGLDKWWNGLRKK